MLLAIDTSTSAVTAALHDGRDVVARTSTIDARRHTEILAPAIEAMFAETDVAPADLSRVAVGVGPGPFTGLRVGVMTAMTFAYALDLPIGGVCSLDALAHRAHTLGMRGPLLVATDARRKEIYWAHYDLDGGPIVPGDPAVDKAAAVAEQLGDIPAVGRGARLYADVLHDATRAAAASAVDTSGDAALTGAGEAEVLLDVDAADLAIVAHQRVMAGERLLDTEPLYLRRPDAVPAAAAPIARVLGR
ncbi:tRNA (adenosine(37)-N6)-threonylcarbamoyltransferase complex dimerization subunit type 1 TsaB [Dermacoccus nishinomiyaensis]|uniref:tRNA (adenosine(37)-N6)-threonylcarbamoyltransferase complex dimerization subunit type 1 TsaB n=1 Tax=Dermacoccus nishinomiyaensis TaxID=1274 RepID=UPI000E01C26A|nr:tRNA (adenosine(37)-N6)-threonylcarbamoyltransferase complex dimerization subunit type 1 TsaB [Dermacoccus nishinomiyaensis]QQY24269.1 tRNA (adenosine(37)-N6)-threonylcarbamoyltransferase complex dimerization subunit type 1 TsaB [Dermacoccus nishinomiyaensis]STD71330.1 UGMP family protein [Dermacoccus nishinomiyaensis]